MIEVASIGPEAAAGFPGEPRMLPMMTQAVAQISGRFISISCEAFAVAASQSEEIREMATACKNWLLLQCQQMAACNAVHTAEARFCRWLLRASEALATETVPVKQETIAQALGIRRTTATLIAQKLRLRRAISYGRGKIAIRDRTGLQAAACECCHAFGHAHWP